MPSQKGMRDETFKIFVGGLSKEVPEESLRQYFSQFGTITDAVVMTDKDTGASRGFGFVTFDTQDPLNPDPIAKIMELFNQHKINGKWIEVKRADGDKKKPPEKKAGPDGVVPECADFKRGKCTRGKDCKYNHGMIGGCINPQVDGQSASLPLPKQPGLASITLPPGVTPPALASPGLAPVVMAGSSDCRIVVSGFQNTVEKEDIQEYFSIFGTIVEVDMTPEKDCCYVNFADRTALVGTLQAAAKKAHEIKGAPVVIDIASFPAPKPTTAVSQDICPDIAALQAAAVSQHSAADVQQAHLMAISHQLASLGGEGMARYDALSVLRASGVDPSTLDPTAAAAIQAQVDQLAEFYRANTEVPPAPVSKLPHVEYRGFGTNTFRRIFITKVSPEIDRQCLVDHFQQFGELEDVYIPEVNHKGVAFVTFGHTEYAQAAVRAKHHYAKTGHPALICGEAMEKPKVPPLKQIGRAGPY